MELDGALSDAEIARARRLRPRVFRDFCGEIGRVQLHDVGTPILFRSSQRTSRTTAFSRVIASIMM